MSKVKEVLVKTCEIQCSMYKSTKTVTKLFLLNVHTNRTVENILLELECAKPTEDYSKYNRL